MDDLTYFYKPNTKLDKVTEAAPDAATGEYDKYNDIKKGQQDGNYQYNKEYAKDINSSTGQHSKTSPSRI